MYSIIHHGWTSTNEILATIFLSLETEYVCPERVILEPSIQESQQKDNTGKLVETCLQLHQPNPGKRKSLVAQL